MTQFHLNSFMPISNVPCSVFLFFFWSCVRSMTLHTEAASVLPVVLRGVRLGVLMPGMDEGERSSVCGSLVCVSDWLTAVMSHRGVTYGCNLALITYTITLTLIRLSLRWAVTDTVGGKKKKCVFRVLRRMNVLKLRGAYSETEQTLADLHKAIMQRLKPNVPRKPLDFTQRGAGAKSSAPCRVMNHRQRCGPDPGVALLWTTTSSPNNLLNDCRQKARSLPEWPCLASRGGRLEDGTNKE